MKRFMRIGLTVALMAAAPVAAMAQYKLNPNAPIGVSAEEFRHDESSCSEMLSGGVELTQDRMRIRASTVRVMNQRRGGDCATRVQRLEASGNVFYVTPDRTVRADNATYNVQSGEVVFTGGVVAVEGRDVSTADRMTINTDTDAVAFTGRVRGVVYPEESAGQ